MCTTDSGIPIQNMNMHEYYFGKLLAMHMKAY